jgi:3-keto-disaccharide hydrolase
MSRTLPILFAFVVGALSGVVVLSQIAAEPFPAPKIEPPIVTPAAVIGDPPSDALVLFDGKNLSHWRSAKDGGDAKWQLQDGYLEIVPKTGDIATREEFGDCQLHVEWATPAVIEGVGQGRGNSGVFLMQRYEVQVLDSYQNKTYYHGQAGSIYKQYAPLVNASRAPGQWQTYDIVFKAPKFDDQGRVIERARITVVHNGVLVQNNVEIYGTTSNDKPALYVAHAAKAPLQLQNHGNLVRYRNIWIRQL